MRASTGRAVYSLQKPLHELMELNNRTLQNLSYFHPVDMINAQRPGEIWEKNMDVLVQNGHQMLDYFHDVCNILEKSWLIVSYDVLEQNHRAMQQPISDAEELTRKNFSATKKGAGKKA